MGGDDRPAFYALRPGGWRDYVTLLHPPYTAWHLSYVAIGAAVAPRFSIARLVASLVGFFLAVGIAAHALDEYAGRPLQTRISDRTLQVLAGVGLIGAVLLGLVGAVFVTLVLVPFIAFGAFTVRLEVVGQHDECPERDERHQDQRDKDGSDQAEQHRADQPHAGQDLQGSIRDQGLQRPSRVLIERMGRDPHRQEKSDQTGYKPRDRKAGCHRGPDCHVGQVPGRVRWVEQRHIVAPAAWPQRIERRPVIPAHRAPYSSPRQRPRLPDSSPGLEQRTSPPPATSSADPPTDICHRTSRCSARGIGPRRATISRRGLPPEA